MPVSHELLDRMNQPDPGSFFRYLYEDCHYVQVVIMSDGSLACVSTSLAFTDAILYDLDYSGYADRWCYEKFYAQFLARQALLDWCRTDDEEPSGWHRHPDSGRRMDAHGNIYINP